MEKGAWISSETALDTTETMPDERTQALLSAGGLSVRMNDDARSPIEHCALGYRSLVIPSAVGAFANFAMLSPLHGDC